MEGSDFFQILIKNYKRRKTIENILGGKRVESVSLNTPSLQVDCLSHAHKDRVRGCHG